MKAHVIVCSAPSGLFLAILCYPFIILSHTQSDQRPADIAVSGDSGIPLGPGSPAPSRFDPPELQAPVMCERRALLGELTSHLGGIRWNLSSLQLSKRDGSENWVPHGTPILIIDGI